LDWASDDHGSCVVDATSAVHDMFDLTHTDAGQTTLTVG